MITTLPDNSWAKSPDLQPLVAALGADNMRWVGGCVRDTLLGKTPADIDCATTHRPETVMELCKKASIRTVPTAIEYGTIVALLECGPIEITTLRRDVSTDGRGAIIAYADSWAEDAARRDFTINALYAHPETLEIDDFFGGIDDLEARRVRFIGNAQERILEDHIRILRYFRFQSRFAGGAEECTLEVCSNLANLLANISVERIVKDLTKILELDNADSAIKMMEDTGVLPIILPEAPEGASERLRDLIAQEAFQNAQPNVTRRLAALIAPDGAIAKNVSERLKLSKNQGKRLALAAERSPDDQSYPFAAAYRYGYESACDRLLLSGSSIAPLDEWTIPKFPLTGGEIIALGIPAGPQISQLMKSIEDRWIAEGFPNRNRVFKIAACEIQASLFADQAKTA